MQAANSDKCCLFMLRAKGGKKLRGFTSKEKRGKTLSQSSRNIPQNKTKGSDNKKVFAN